MPISGRLVGSNSGADRGGYKLLHLACYTRGKRVRVWTADWVRLRCGQVQIPALTSGLLHRDNRVHLCAASMGRLLRGQAMSP